MRNLLKTNNKLGLIRHATGLISSESKTTVTDTHTECTSDRYDYEFTFAKFAAKVKRNCACADPYSQAFWKFIRIKQGDGSTTNNGPTNLASTATTRLSHRPRVEPLTTCPQV